jgi:DNA-binding NarL/FixJ family response regulator
VRITPHFSAHPLLIWHRPDNCVTLISVDKPTKDKLSEQEASSQPLRVVVVDDHKLTANSIGDALERHGMLAIARAHSAADAIEACATAAPDALVTDLDLGPGPTGIDVALEVRKRNRHVGIVILTGYEDPRLLDSRLPALPPACVYMVKHKLDDTTDVVEAVRLAVRLIRTSGEKDPVKPRVSLTDSQVDILRLVASGLSNQAIAARLSLTVSAVEKAINRLARKLEVDNELGVNTRVGLTHRYLDMVGYVRD